MTIESALFSECPISYNNAFQALDSILTELRIRMYIKELKNKTYYSFFCIFRTFFRTLLF